MVVPGPFVMLQGWLLDVSVQPVGEERASASNAAGIAESAAGWKAASFSTLGPGDGSSRMAWSIEDIGRGGI